MTNIIALSFFNQYFINPKKNDSRKGMEIFESEIDP